MLKGPTETAFTEQHANKLVDLGFTPLVNRKGMDGAGFFSIPTCQHPKKYGSEVAHAESRLSTQLRYVLTTSRFAHYIRLIIAERVGAFQSRAESERMLQAWVQRYVTNDDTASLDAKAQYPLREAKIQVVEVPGRPGLSQAILFLRPSFQLDAPATLRLVVDLHDAEAYM